MAKQTKKTSANNSASKTVATSGVSKSRSAVSGRYVKASTAVRNPRSTAPRRTAKRSEDVEPLSAVAVGADSVDPAQPASWMTGPVGPDDVDEATIKRLVIEAEEGIPEEKLRRRGRPSIGQEASSTYSVRLPDDLAALADERSAMDGVSRGETMRRALIQYLTG